MKKGIIHNLQIFAIALAIVGLLVIALSGFLGQTVSYVLKPWIGIQSWLSTRFTIGYEFFTSPRDAASLRQRNLELENEVSRLQTQLIQLEEQQREAQVLYALLEFARSSPQSEFVAAAVIGRDPSPFLHYVIIDKGSDDGIRSGMPVVTQQGLVGRVDAVIASASRIQLITDPASSVNIRIQSIGIDALLNGSVTGDITVQMIPQDVSIQPGELILTSGLGGNYPPDIVVGKTLGIRRLETDLFQTATIQPSVDMNILRAVLVIKNFRPVNISPLVATPSLP